MQSLHPLVQSETWDFSGQSCLYLEKQLPDMAQSLCTKAPGEARGSWPLSEAFTHTLALCKAHV